MSFIYPRVVSISRPAAQTGVGAIGYGGQTKATETQVAQALPASIQAKKEGSRPDAGLPGDASKRTYWRVFIPAASLAKGQILARDIVTDDLGTRYQVLAPYWNSLGHNLMCELLET